MRTKPDIAGAPRLSHSVVDTYETRLSRNLGWALNEADQYFSGGGAVHKTLRDIAHRLDQLGIPYAVAGGMSLFVHGYRRFTEDVDILIKRSDLKLIHDQLEGRGYLRPHPHSKNLRDTEGGVKIEFLIEGDFPGDGLQKPVSFPDPSSVFEDIDGIKFLQLATLIELKLASGMTGADRGKDLADVQELIRLLNLPSDYDETLSPYVREKYKELWAKGRRRYIDIWRPEHHTPTRAAELLAAMQADGITLEYHDNPHHPRLVTTNPTLAEKYGLIDEADFWEGS